MSELQSLLHQAGISLPAQFMKVLSGPTGMSSSGYPYISHGSFQLFLRSTPFLFQNGAKIVEKILNLQKHIENKESDLARSLQVIRTVIYTAAVTAPTDLWILRHILSTHRKVGILDDLKKGTAIGDQTYCLEREVGQQQLLHDLGFLYSRGYLEKTEEGTALQIYLK